MTSLTPASEPYFDLGTFGRRIRTTSPEAQTWFDRGLTWIYGFHHEEAAICLETAIVHDPGCVMAYWALAYALGPNYNFIWDFFEPDQLETAMRRTHKALDDARSHLKDGDPVESALIQALEARYPRDWAGKEFKTWNENYVKAMEKVYNDFPNDLDVAAVYADSMMCLVPWKLWDLRTGEPEPGSPAKSIQRVLEKALVQPEAATHPGLLHLYIHLCEMSSSPERAVPAADKLFGLIPDAAHLNHMPSHLDILIGDYRRAISANAKAVVSDNLYVSRKGAGGFYTIYRLHNFSSLIYGAMFCGQYQVAIRFVEAMEQVLTDDLVRSLPKFIECETSVRLHVLVRFGRWDEILKVPFPDDRQVYASKTVMTHYARGIAFAATNRVDEALVELNEVRESIKRVPPEYVTFPNTTVDVLAIAEPMLSGEIEYRRENYDVAFEHLRQAIKLYDGLQYAEPWAWMMPVRHPYAALQLERGNIEEALATYAADLGYDTALPRAHQHPNNVWALHGYHECLVKLGRTAEAQIIMPQLRLALAVADVEIKSSCFCRLDVTDKVVDGAGSHCCD
ncbi:hypothetical protein BCR39DRAFT_549970 [Naematelia encephala]|uniref:TPR domain protein n=1 Tax=Naematelia encephala TaxID=71784 RepID=A0A1Y2AKN9_9TREE|nr:hypothetical protein BCR39DRAFT_549970 [Naematelia encephala]